MNRDDIIKNENTVIKLQDNEVLRVTAEGEFIWNERADEMIASGDYSQYPSLRHVLMALREHERLLEALKMIAGESLCIDNLMSDKDIARAALRQEEPK